MNGLQKLTNALSNGTIPDPYGLPFLEIGGLQLSYPLLSEEQVKLRTSNLAGTFTGQIRYLYAFQRYCRFCAPACHFFATPLLVSPKFLHVLLVVSVMGINYFKSSLTTTTFSTTLRQLNFVVNYFDTKAVKLPGANLTTYKQLTTYKLLFNYYATISNTAEKRPSPAVWHYVSMKSC